MRTLIGFFIMFLLFSHCQEIKTDCVSYLVASVKGKPKDFRPAGVYRFEQEGKTYYYLTAYCCDFPSDLYDDQCNLICHPDGGITGKGDGKCGNIVVKNLEVIWKDK